MTNEREQQLVSNSTSTTEVETQGITITDSDHVAVTQVEAQGLFVIQTALQAAVEAAVIVLGSKYDNDLSQLQALANALGAAQVQSQDITISGSNNIVVTQTELQVSEVVHAAINLLAQSLIQ